MESWNAVSFTLFKDLKYHLDTLVPISILAVVIGEAPRRTLVLDGKRVRVRQIVLVDTTGPPVYLVLKATNISVEGAMIAKIKPGYDTPIVIAATRVFVSSVAGFSLSLDQDSSFAINPPLEQADRLFLWGLGNASLMKTYAKLIVAKPYTEEKPPLSKRIAIPLCDAWTKAAQVDVTWIWVCVKAALLRDIPTAFYMACESCGERHSADTVGVYVCSRCDSKQYIRPKASFRIEISDDTASMVVLIEGKYAEALFDFSAFALWRNQQRLHRHALPETVKKLSPLPSSSR